MYDKAKKSNKPEDWKRFRTFRNVVRRELDQSHTNYVNSILNVENLKTVPKKFWSYVKAKKRDSAGIPPLQTDNGPADTSKSKAEALNTQYQSVFTVEDTSSIPSMTLW